MGAHLPTFLRGGSDHHRGGVFEGPSVGIWVEEASGCDPGTFRVEDSGFEVNEEPFRVIRQVPEWEAMNGELILVRGRTERKPGEGSNREGLVEASCKGGKEAGVIGARGGGVDPQEGNSAIGVHLGSKEERHGAVGGTEDLWSDIWESGSYGVSVWMRGMYLSKCIKPSSSSRKGGGSRGNGGGGGSEGSDRGRGRFSRFVFGGGSHLCIGVARADAIEVSWDKLGDAGVTAIVKVGDLTGIRVRLGEGSGISVAEVVNGINSRKVRIKSGAVILGGGRGGGFVLGLGTDRRRRLGCQGGAGGGGAYPM